MRWITPSFQQDGSKRGATSQRGSETRSRKRAEKIRRTAERGSQNTACPRLPDEGVQLSDGSVPLVTFQGGALAWSRSSPAKGEEPQVRATRPCPRRGL